MRKSNCGEKSKEKKLKETTSIKIGYIKESQREKIIVQKQKATE